MVASRYLVVWDAYGRDGVAEIEVKDGEDPSMVAARFLVDEEYVKHIDYLLPLPEHEGDLASRANDLLCDLKGIPRPDYTHCVICSHAGHKVAGFPLCSAHLSGVPT